MSQGEGKDEDAPDYSGLGALFVNCTLKPSPQGSHTAKLMGAVEAIMTGAGCSVETVRLVDHHVAPGVYPDMTEHGFDRDDWPAIGEKVKAADILFVGTPIWLGEESSECRKLIERLYAHSGETNDKGQYVFYGKAGGCIVTGNEDGVKHCAMTVLYALSHVGYAIPPQADAGWIGEAGPGPSYGDTLEDGSHAGFDNDFTKRNATFLAWNLMHMAAMLKAAGGIPRYGTDSEAWRAGARFGYPDRGA